ncbi:hypothetical protein KAJ87_01070 [Candidatus Pacearchaeota archaeon]|nr:hypothetical protein [Candidatus Pacearchaeota archaeon]
MEQKSKSEDGPFFFLSTEKYILGTPEGFNVSDKTIDIPFQNLVRNYDLQRKLNLASARFLEKPSWNSHPIWEEEPVECTAIYLASFSKDSKEKEKRRDYLINNGLIRILAYDNIFLKEIKALI